MPANEKKCNAHLYSASVPRNHSQTVQKADTAIPIVIHRAGLRLHLAEKARAISVSQLLGCVESCLICPQMIQLSEFMSGEEQLPGGTQPPTQEEPSANLHKA